MGSSASVVVSRKEAGARKEPVPKVEAKVSRKSPEEELTVGEMLSAPEKPRVEPGKMQEARTSFFSSMIAASSSASPATSSVQKLGTSIMPTVSADDRDKFSRIEKEKQATGGRSRGKALFQKMAEREKEKEKEGEEEEEEARLLPV